jgi:hypothetical protein
MTIGSREKEFWYKNSYCDTESSHPPLRDHPRLATGWLSSRKTAWQPHPPAEENGRRGAQDHGSRIQAGKTLYPLPHPEAGSDGSEPLAGTVIELLKVSDLRSVSDQSRRVLYERTPLPAVRALPASLRRRQTMRTS